jgi:hypothetical protein
MRRRVWGMPAMRRFLAALILVLCVAGVARAGARSTATEAFTGGNRAYQAGNYAESLRLYREALAAGYASPDLFLNLGNASYRLGELGWSVYYFEQARRRAPRDPDIRSNLNLARSEALGGEQVPSSSALLDALVAIEDRIGLATAVWVSMVMLWIADALLLYGWRAGVGSRSRRLRWFALGLAVVAVVLVSVKAGQASLAPRAMIVHASAAHTEPTEDSTVEFRLPAGSPVSLGRERAGWSEVVVSASLRGWVPSDAVASFETPH